MRELDFWFKTYMDNAYPTASLEDKNSFEQLLKFHDQDLFDWLMGNTQPTDRNLLPIIDSIRLTASQANNMVSGGC